jgi:hypothetical protein
MSNKDPEGHITNNLTLCVVIYRPIDRMIAKQTYVHRHKDKHTHTLAHIHTYIEGEREII